MKTETVLLIVGGLFLFMMMNEKGNMFGGRNILNGEPPLPQGGRDFRYGPPAAPAGSTGRHIQEIETGVKAVVSIWDDFKGLFN